MIALAALACSAVVTGARRRRARHRGLDDCHGPCAGLDLVAEGVEDEATAVVLREMRCDSAQGFHFAHPLPADELSAWLRTRLTAPAAQAAFL